MQADLLIEMQISMVDVAVASAAAWRITHLLHAEDGPWDWLVRLRRLAGQGVWGKMLNCFYCTSVWTAIPIAAVLGHTWVERMLLWPGLSGAAILIERALPHRATPMAEWHEEAEKETLQGESI